MQSLPHPLRFDADRLPRLLELVGPAEARTFLGQLDRDLSDCARDIERAVGHLDWPALRNASHVLVSLAGASGALALQSLAEALNAAAHARDAGIAHGLQGQLAADLDRLIAVVRATPTPLAGPQ
jgi:hypothetical protein